MRIPFYLQESTKKNKMNVGTICLMEALLTEPGLLWPGSCLNSPSKHYRNKRGIAQDPREQLVPAAHQCPRAAGLQMAPLCMPSTSAACVHLGSLPRHDHARLLIKEISNKNYMPDSHRCHLTSLGTNRAWLGTETPLHTVAHFNRNSVDWRLPAFHVLQFSAADVLPWSPVSHVGIPRPLGALPSSGLASEQWGDYFPGEWALWKERYSRVLLPPLENEAAQSSVADLSAPFKKQHKEDEYQAISATSLLRSLCLNYWEK